jgi:hypothetical protein
MHKVTERSKDNVILPENNDLVDMGCAASENLCSKDANRERSSVNSEIDLRTLKLKR